MNKTKTTQAAEEGIDWYTPSVLVYGNWSLVSYDVDLPKVFKYFTDFKGIFNG